MTKLSVEVTGTVLIFSFIWGENILRPPTGEAPLVLHRHGGTVVVLVIPVGYTDITMERDKCRRRIR